MRSDHSIPELSADLNRVLLVGMLAEAPEVREVGADSAVCFLRLHCGSPSAVVARWSMPFEINVLLLEVSAFRGTPPTARLAPAIPRWASAKIVWL
jgi:hypothetical protein